MTLNATYNKIVQASLLLWFSVYIWMQKSAVRPQTYMRMKEQEHEAEVTHAPPSLSLADDSPALALKSL